jgi:two-component system catabolic regulation response regulator CreB
LKFRDWLRITQRMATVRQNILVVEDDPPIAETIVYALETEGFTAIWKSTAREAREVLAHDSIALVVLDVGLPDGNGFDLCREFRQRLNVPVIFLTARSGEVDRVVGLEIGGDDYLAKPFSPRELTARVRAVLRRTGELTGATNVSTLGRTGVWQHDAVRCRIAYRGRTLELTRNEYRLLGVLLAQPGRVFSRDQLMTAAWDDPGAALDRTVDAHVKMLRAKLREVAPESDPVVTHRGLGYSLREES